MFNSQLLPTSPTPMKRYRVMRDGRQIGTVMANNISHATTKAFQLFKRHIYVERLP
jgi:hypothetical protein